MNIETFGINKTGDLVPISGIPSASHAFVPYPIPPQIEFSQGVYRLSTEAQVALARLDGMGEILPNPLLLLKPLQRREAKLSLQLEGTITQPDQLLLFEKEEIEASNGTDVNAYRETSNYARALDYAIHQTELPISLRLIRQLHEILLTGVRGQEYTPGEFRREQNQIDHPPRYVPPPPNYLLGCLDNLEKYIHIDRVFDPLIDSFILHYQFEAIHPFRDGNGRVGRLLLAIVIMNWCGLNNLWLYLSPYFNLYRSEYMDLLLNVSKNGEWEEWLSFCLKGVITQAKDTKARIRLLLSIERNFKDRVDEIGGGKRLYWIIENLFYNPIITIPDIINHFQVSDPTARSDIKKLVDTEILVEGPRLKSRTRAFLSVEIMNAIYRDIPENAYGQ